MEYGQNQGREILDGAVTASHGVASNKPYIQKYTCRTCRMQASGDEDARRWAVSPVSTTVDGWKGKAGGWWSGAVVRTDESSVGGAAGGWGHWVGPDTARFDKEGGPVAQQIEDYCGIGKHYLYPQAR